MRKQLNLDICSYTQCTYLRLSLQVCSADARVKQLRDEVPLALTEAIQKHLVACRPVALEADEATFSIVNSAGETDVINTKGLFYCSCDNDAF